MGDPRPPILVFRSARQGRSFEAWLLRKVHPELRRTVTAALAAMLPREESAVATCNRCRRHGPGLYCLGFSVRGLATRSRAQASSRPRGPLIAVNIFFTWLDGAPVVLNDDAVLLSGLPAPRGTPGLGDARRRLRELRAAEGTGVLHQRLVLDGLEDIRCQSRAAVPLHATHDPDGALVLFEDMLAVVRSEAARLGPAALCHLHEVETRIRLGVGLEAARLAQGSTQRELSGVSGISQHDISDIESGRANPTLSTLCALTRVLGVELAVRGVG